MKLLLTIMLLASSQASAQSSLSFDVGLISTGPLATEVTHRVRIPSMPGALYVGATFDSPLTKYVAWTVRASYTRTNLEIERCEPQPCAPADRDHRPVARNIELEPDFTIINARAGLRLSVIEWATAAVGVALPVVECPYSQCGAQTMLVWGYWGDVRVLAPLSKRVRLGMNCSVTAIPSQGSPSPRWTVLSERSGLKQIGGQWPNAERRDPQRVDWYQCGLTTALRLP